MEAPLYQREKGPTYQIMMVPRVAAAVEEEALCLFYFVPMKSLVVEVGAEAAEAAAEAAAVP